MPSGLRETQSSGPTHGEGDVMRRDALSKFKYVALPEICARQFSWQISETQEVSLVVRIIWSCYRPSVLLLMLVSRMTWPLASRRSLSAMRF